MGTPSGERGDYAFAGSVRLSVIEPSQFVVAGFARCRRALDRGEKRDSRQRLEQPAHIAATHLVAGCQLVQLRQEHRRLHSLKGNA